MTDFSDSGHHNPVMDEGGLEAAIKLGKHAQKFPGGDELPKVDAPTGMHLLISTVMPCRNFSFPHDNL